MVRKNNKKVVVAMSGGIDSSVAAALLKRAGFNVVGVFMKFWSPPGKKGLAGAWNRCCSPEAEKRAGWVAKSLGIPFYVFNVEKEFKKRIVDYFLAGYKKGITPNPCVVCNREIKFGLLLEKALALGADYLATGHYAKIRKFVSRALRSRARRGSLNFVHLTSFASLGQMRRSLSDHSQQIRYSLISAKDKTKDQSYFLWQLNQKQLKHILFPVGDLTKTQVKNLAKKFMLPVFDIPESMEICFIQTTINDFLKKYLRPKPGPIVDTSGALISRHRGLWFYTIGQRKGLGLASGPYYVLDKNLKKNFLVVTRNEKDLFKKELLVKNVNWIAGKKPKLPLKVRAKIRYRHQPATATLTYNLKLKTYNLKFEKPQRAITPGQSAVFYKGKELIGGGIIS